MRKYICPKHNKEIKQFKITGPGKTFFCEQCVADPTDSDRVSLSVLLEWQESLRFSIESESASRNKLKIVDGYFHQIKEQISALLDQEQQRMLPLFRFPKLYRNLKGRTEDPLLCALGYRQEVESDREKVKQYLRLMRKLAEESRLTKNQEVDVMFQFMLDFRGSLDFISHRVRRAIDLPEIDTRVLYRQMNLDSQSRDIKMAFCNDLILDNKPREALEISLRIEKLYPNNVGVINLVAHCYYLLDQYENAKNKYIKCVQLGGLKHEYHFNLANTYKKMKSYEQAIQCYHAALDICAGHVPSCANLAICYKQTKQYELAAAQYEKILAVQQDNSLVRYNYSILLFEVGQIEQAIAQAEKAVALSPDNRDFSGNLSKLRRKSCSLL